MCVLERWTVSRTAFCSAIFLRVAFARLALASNLSLISSHLLLLRFLERDLLVGIAHALALVRLGTAIAPHFRGNLANELPVGALDHDLRLRRRFSFDAFRQRVHDRVRVAEREIELFALRLRAVAHAEERQAL